jgi:hypothetical protein
MSDDATTRHSRNALHHHLPLINVVALVAAFCGGAWWMSNQSRDITDARRVADEALSAAKAASVASADQQLRQVEVLAKLSGIEAQLAELRALFLRGKP